MKTIPPFVAIDLETTGLEFDNNEIIEIALVRFENAKAVDSVDYLIKPSKAKLRPFISELTGITQDDLNGAEEFSSVAQKIVEFVGDLPLVAHNAAFDSKFLKQAMANVGIDYESHVFWDSLTLSRIAFQNAQNHRLETLVEELGIERSRAHRALPDAEACGSLFVLAYNKIKEMDAWLLNALAKIAENSTWEEIFENFDANTLELKRENFLEIPEKEQEFVRTMRVEKYFSEGGILSQKMADYVPRLSQLNMANIVERNLFKGGACVLEPYAGLGSTLAYLIPAMNRAVVGERVIVSTATKAVQDKVVNEIEQRIMPLMEGKLNYSILKSRENYLCLRKFNELLKHTDLLLSPEEKDSFMVLLPWALSTQSGEINECTAFNLNRNRTLWAKLSSAANSCMGENCSHNNNCPYFNAHKNAKNAQIVVTQHQLVLSSMISDTHGLPLFKHAIFEESQRLHEMSSDFFGKTLTFFGFKNISKTLIPSKIKRDGLFVLLENSIAGDTESIAKIEAIIEHLIEAERALHRFMMKIGKKIQKLGKNRQVYEAGILADYEVDPQNFIETVRKAHGAFDSLKESLATNENIAGLLTTIAGRMGDIMRYLSQFEFVVNANRRDFQFFLEDPFNPHTLKMRACRNYDGKLWKERFYPTVKSSTFVGNVISINSDFSYFENKVGLRNSFTRLFNKPGMRDDTRNVLISKCLPKPSLPEFNTEMISALTNVMSDIKKNSLVLFASVSAMLSAHEALTPIFAEKGKLLLCQNIDGSTDSLLQMMRKSTGACMLASMDSLRGVDLSEGLFKFVAVTKLPFPPPSDIKSAAFTSYFKSRNKNAFKERFVPEAYFELKRIIQSVYPKGLGKMLVLDSRILTEPYGANFAKIWFFKHLVANKLEEIRYFSTEM